jgi:hypothetical protein
MPGNCFDAFSATVIAILLGHCLRRSRRRDQERLAKLARKSYLIHHV